MGSVQQMLAIGAVVILTLLILSSTKDMNYKYEESYSNEAIIVGSGLAQSMISEIQSRAFDELTISDEVSDADSLTTSYGLGPDYGESLTEHYDDIDDFDQYAIIDSVDNIGHFYVIVSVYYVSPTNPETMSTKRTFCKKIDVSVTNEYLPSDLKQSQIICY